jgi:hypothetical protein
MKFFYNLILVMILTIIFSSCAKLDIVELNKGKNARVISLTYNNSGEVKLINQKYNTKNNVWFEAKCEDENILFINCSKEKIFFTKLALTKINFLEESKRDSINNDVSQEGSSENDKSEEKPPEDYNEQPSGECEGGPEVC